jgi:uncharacterized tellurite resistance protein B-like protein
MLHCTMHDQNLALLKGLVCVAWADGKIAPEEMEIVEGLLLAFSASPSECLEVRTFAKTPRTIDDVPLTDLSASDRRMLLHQSVLMTFADGHQSQEELDVLNALAQRLHIGSAEADAILASGTAHAKSMLYLLEQRANA